MASCTTSKWDGKSAPVAQLSVTQSSSTGNTVTLSYTLYYIANYAASTNGIGRAWSITIDGTTVASGTYNINGVTGTKTIKSGTVTVSKTHAARNVAFSCSFTFDLTWSEHYGGTKTASSSISISATTSYTVSYNANGGSGAPSAQTKWYNETLTLSSTVPTRSNYEFLGWSTSSTSTSASYEAGGSYTSNSATTLYAVWQLNAYYLDLNGYLDGASANSIAGFGTADVYVGGTLQSGDCSDYYIQHTSGSSYEIKDIKATTGHTYNGVYSGSLTGTIETSNVSVSLKFTTNTYSITFDANGGSGAPSAQTKTYGVDLTLSSTEPTRTGHTFQGWAESDSATTAAYSAGGSFTENAATKLYAVWKTNTYAVKFDANGGTGAPAQQTKAYGVDLTLSSTEPTRDGYTFKAWGTSATATSGVAPGSQYTANAAITYYAIWTPWSHTVAFNLNGGTGSFTNLTKTSGTTLTLPTAVPTKAGYAFAYWNTAKDGTGTRYAAGATYDYTQNSGTITLYAIWTSSDIVFYSTGTVEALQFVEKDTSTAANSISLASTGTVQSITIVEK